MKCGFICIFLIDKNISQYNTSCAVKNEHECALEMVRLLLEKGADIDQSDLDTFPLLYWIEKQNESALDILRLLWKKGVDINLKVGKNLFDVENFGEASQAQTVKCKPSEGQMSPSARVEER